MSITAKAYFLETFGSPLVAGDLDLAPAGVGEAIVEVIACGMCHTDLGFASGSVKPNHALPLVLGHEVMGRVIEAGESSEHLVGRSVIVPAVLPCLECDFCRAGRSNACPRQKMPGNDVHGGFATHMCVPAAPLVPLVDTPEHVDERALSVVADAVSTAYQAVVRAGLEAGDAAFVVGAGGVGGFLTQIAAALGARVVACDISDERLAVIGQYGAEVTVNVQGREPRDVRKQLHGLAREWGIGSHRFRIFECSGTSAGQQLSYTLLSRAATLLLVGYTFEKVTLRLSNLMAFDATAAGTWGCPPEAYPDVLRMIYSGDVVLEPFVEYAPLSSINRQFEAMAAHQLTRRMVFDPKI